MNSTSPASATGCRIETYVTRLGRRCCVLLRPADSAPSFVTCQLEALGARRAWTRDASDFDPPLPDAAAHECHPVLAAPSGARPGHVYFV